MSFQDLHLDSAQEKRLSELKTALRQPEYQPGGGSAEAPDQIFENLDQDPQIPDRAAPDRPASREELLSKLIQSDSAGLERSLREAREFSRLHQQEGDEVAMGQEMGHIHDLGKLADWLHDAASGLSRAETRAWLRDLIRLPGGMEQRRSAQQEALPDRALAPYQMWSFYTGGGEEPFEALEARRSVAVNRLGLGHLTDPAIELVYWTHRMPPEMTAHRPTAWDSDLASPYWRPTGRTEPLDGSGSENGFPEAVHPPVAVEALVHPLSEVSEE